MDCFSNGRIVWNVWYKHACIVYVACWNQSCTSDAGLFGLMLTSSFVGSMPCFLTETSPWVAKARTASFDGKRTHTWITMRKRKDEAMHSFFPILDSQRILIRFRANANHPDESQGWCCIVDATHETHEQVSVF